MGWMAWVKFRCHISEDLVKTMADHIVSAGYKDVGYEYVSIDDCWMAHNRTAWGELQPNPTAFPNGMKAVADYVHSKGLKLGIYADIGTRTCAGFPGTAGHFQQDMDTFASWGVDYLKLDGCNSVEAQFGTLYPEVTVALNKTGRPIVFSCAWPADQTFNHIKPNYTQVAENCNLWRSWWDMDSNFGRVKYIIDWMGQNQDDIIPAVGCGKWNDPDQLVVGDGGLTVDESKVQFAIWAIMAAPLQMSNDLRDFPDWAREILQNREVIAVNQDKLCKMGRRVFKGEETEVWARPLYDGSVAVALFSRAQYRGTMFASFEMVGLPSSMATARDLFEHKDLGKYQDMFTAEVNPNGVVMVKLTPVKDLP